MKKLLIILVSIVAISLIMAAAPTYSVVDGNYEGGGDSTITSVYGDTVSATESDTIGTFYFNGYNNGWQYILGTGKVTGDGNDSVRLHLNIDAIDKDNNHINRTLVDSLTDSLGKNIVIPILGTVFGTKYQLVLDGQTGNGGDVILPRLYLYKRRVCVKEIPWGR